MPSSKVVGGPDDRRSKLTVYLYAPDNGGEAGGKVIPYMFRPMVGYVEPGTEVRWEHAGNESTLHSSTAFGGASTDPQLIPDDAKPWNSGPFPGSKDPYRHTFEEPGVYAYYCMPHKDFGMSGLLVVGDVGPGDPGWSPGMTRPLDELDQLAPMMKKRLRKFRGWVRNGGSTGSAGSDGAAATTPGATEAVLGDDARWR